MVVERFKSIDKVMAKQYCVWSNGNTIEDVGVTVK